jgi:hypothetical protein
VCRTAKKPIAAPRCFGSAAIGRDRPQRLGRGPKQDPVHDGFVERRDRGDGVRHGEDEVEVWAVEDLGLALLDPLRPREGLALRAVAIAAGVVPDARVLAAVTLLHVAAERGGPALLDRPHHPSLGERHRVREPIAIPVAADNVRHLERGAHVLAGRSGRRGVGV